MPERTRDRLREDARRLRRYLRSKYGYAPVTWFLEPAWLCVVLHRLSHRAFRRGHGKAARFWMQANSLLTGADIQPASDLGPGLLIPSPVGVTVSGKAGAGLTVLALAGLGGNVPTRDVGAGPGLPLLGHSVQAGQFVGIQGAITVGDGALFDPGAGAVVNVAASAHMVPQAEPLLGERPEPPPPHGPVPPCAHASWRATAADWRQDIRHTVDEMMRLAPPGARRPRALGVIATNPLLALWAYRVSHWLHCNGWRRLARLPAWANLLLHKLTIPPDACLGGGVLMPHLAGTVLHGQAGADLRVFANAVCSGLGGAFGTPPGHAPRLGDGVMIGGHSGVFGPVALGGQVQLGPKVQVRQDVADGMQVWDPHSRGTVEPGGPPAGPHPVAAARAEEPPIGQAWRRMRQDRARRLAVGWGRPAYTGPLCTGLHRLSHACHRAGALRPARWLAVLNAAVTGADITPGSDLAGGLLLPHPAGLALHGRAGANLTVLAMSGFGTLLDGGETLPELDRAPALGRDVHLSHHCGVFGAVTVGDGVAVLPGCIVRRCVPDGSAVLPRPLRVRDRGRVERLRAAQSSRSGGGAEAGP